MALTYDRKQSDEDRQVSLLLWSLKNYSLAKIGRHIGRTSQGLWVAIRKETIPQDLYDVLTLDFEVPGEYLPEPRPRVRGRPVKRMRSHT